MSKCCVRSLSLLSSEAVISSAEGLVEQPEHNGKDQSCDGGVAIDASNFAGQCCPVRPPVHQAEDHGVEQQQKGIHALSVDQIPS